MPLNQAFARFVAKAPLSVMVQGALENIFHPDAINDLFERTAQTQYTRELLFSTVMDTMTLVACGIYKTPHAVYQDNQDWFPVSITSLYNKLHGIETVVSAELVRDSAGSLGNVIRALGGKLPPLLPGYMVKILDGNALAATEHRLKETRDQSAAPLPGKSLVVLDPQLMLAVDVFPCEDGHAQERSLLPQVLATILAGELWIEDRNFCTLGFLFGIERKNAFFLVREHKNLPWTAISKLRCAGRTETGEVFEQIVRLEDENGDILFARRVVVKLDKPTRDGETEIALLSNVWDNKVSALQLAELYRRRWTIEGLFLVLTEALTCENPGLNYPKAALFGFCMALVAYNVLSLVKAALRVVHGGQLIEQTLSLYYVVSSLARNYGGMMVALPEHEWAVFRTLDAEGLAGVLLDLAGHVDLARYTKHPRKPKKPPPERNYDPKHPHVSTAKLLEQRRQSKKQQATKQCQGSDSAP
jgi:Transposase DDE domain